MEFRYESWQWINVLMLPLLTFFSISFYFDLSSLFSFFFRFDFFAFFFKFWFSYSSQCPLEFYRSEPYTSLPLLSIVRTLSSNALFEPSGRHAVKESRSYYGYHDPVNSISKDDFTRDNSSTEQDHGIRLISLPFVARNIFKDIFVQRLDAIGRFLKFATHAWTRW